MLPKNALHADRHSLIKLYATTVRFLECLSHPGHRPMLLASLPEEVLSGLSSYIWTIRDFAAVQDVVQVAPFTVKEVGLGLLPFQEPLKPGPGLIAAPAGTWPL